MILNRAAFCTPSFSFSLSLSLPPQALRLKAACIRCCPRSISSDSLKHICRLFGTRTYEHDRAHAHMHGHTHACTVLCLPYICSVFPLTNIGSGSSLFRRLGQKSCNTHAIAAVLLPQLSQVCCAILFWSAGLANTHTAHRTCVSVVALFRSVGIARVPILRPVDYKL